MNCQNCGAVMKFIDGRNYFVCQYCTSFQFPATANKSPDGVTLLSEHSELLCPVCALPLAGGAIDGQHILFCHNCRGVLATNANFATIIKLRRAAHEGPNEIPAPLDPEQLLRHVRCPACRSPMAVHPYYGPGSVVVDTCPDCHLIWLDHGEIGVIQKAPGHR
jgi:Zn-finger nucleic acid-binding protein